MKNKNPLISVIVVTWNGKQYIERLLRSLLKAVHKYPTVEVIIIDNGSSDGTPELIETFVELFKGRLKLKKLSKNLGFAGGNNIGIELAKGSIVFLLNQDTYVDEQVFECAARLFGNEPEVGAAQCLLLQYRFPHLLDSCGDEFSSLGTGIIGCHGKTLSESADYLKKREITLARGAALFLRKEILNFSKKIYGIYLPIYFVAPYYEDWFLSLFTKMLGYKVVLIPECKVYHESLKPIHRNPYTLYNSLNLFINFRAKFSMIIGTILTMTFSAIFISKQPLKLFFSLFSLARKLKNILRIRFYADALMKLKGLSPNDLWRGGLNATAALRWYISYLRMIKKLNSAELPHI